MKHGVLIALTSLCFILFQNCAPAKFSGQESNSSTGSVVTPRPATPIDPTPPAPPIPISTGGGGGGGASTALKRWCALTKFPSTSSYMVLPDGFSYTQSECESICNQGLAVHGRQTGEVYFCHFGDYYSDMIKRDPSTYCSSRANNYYEMLSCAWIM